MEQKGYKKYIECDAAKEAVCTIIVPEWVRAAFKSCIDDVPAAEVRPVVRATWKRIDYKPRGHDYECSTCGWKNDMATRFCPGCGADMREEP